MSGALGLALAGLCSLRLGKRSIWFDEAVSVSYAKRSWADLWDVVTGSDPNMSVYYALLKIWVAIFGDGLWAVRSLSVVAAALTVPVIYALGMRLLGPQWGLAAAVLLSTNAYFLSFAQEARSYALVTLLVTVSMYFFFADLDRLRRTNRVAYILTSSLAFYAHFFAGGSSWFRPVPCCSWRKEDLGAAGWPPTPRSLSSFCRSPTRRLPSEEIRLASSRGLAWVRCRTPRPSWSVTATRFLARPERSASSRCESFPRCDPFREASGSSAAGLRCQSSARTRFHI